MDKILILIIRIRLLVDTIRLLLTDRILFYNK